VFAVAAGPQLVHACRVAQDRMATSLEAERLAEYDAEEDAGPRNDACPLIGSSGRQKPARLPRYMHFGACSLALLGGLCAFRRRAVAARVEDWSTREIEAAYRTASCAHYGCQHSFVAEHSCQCDADCTRERNDCCADFDSACKGSAGAEDRDFQERPTAEALEMARKIARTIMAEDGTQQEAPEEDDASRHVKEAAQMLMHIMDHATATTSAPSEPQTTTEARRWPYPSLFCWLVMRTGGYEVPLVRAQHANRVGIFDCDEYAVYSNGGVMQIENLITIPLPAPSVKKGNFNVPGTTTDSWLNTLIFMEAWAMIVEDGTWWNHEWTVKVDPDAVFFPDRLRELLLIATPDPGEKPRYVGNCDRSWHSEPATLKLFGSLEIYSRDAVGSYKAFGARCKSELNWKGWGEDFYMQRCMEMLGALPVNGTSLLADKRCKPAPCTDSTKVAFHDFKDVQSYFDCWGQSRINAVSI